MNTNDLLDKIKTGELPKMGIIRRTGAAKHIRITTQIDGQTVEIPDVAFPAEEASE